MSAGSRALMLVNPGARRGCQALDVVPTLQGLGLDVAVDHFDCPAEVSPHIVRRAPGVDLVIVCGGDGTVASAAMGLLETGLPMGVLPLGTANDLARTLDLPLDLEAACRVIAAGKRRRIDLGMVNGKAFFNVASLGLSADLAQGLTGDSKRRWGRLAYARQAFKCMAAARPFRAEIESRSEVRTVRTLQIAVGNGRHYGGGQVVHEAASINDGRLDLYSLSPRAVWKLALMFPEFRNGRHVAWDEVTTARCSEFWVRTHTPMPVNTDGELLTQTPAHFVVRPEAVEVFVP